MSDQPQSDSDVVESPESEMYYPGDRDWFLAHLALWANSGMEFGLTLTIGGSIITGTTISGREYLERMRLAFSSFLDGAEQQTVDGSFQNFSERAYSRRGRSLPSFIHLRDAHHIVSGQNGVMRIPTEGMLWRGRLAAIGGFSLGVISSPAG
jgi:hypothetical protein